jgi:hypothetical protein
MNSEEKICIDCQTKFTITSDEFGMYKKVGIVPSILCFSCRIKKILAFWMFGKFRKGRSSISGESLITLLPENIRYPIYKSKEWYSDVWDALDYGLDYDPSQLFFTQLKNLQEKVPHPHQTGTNNTDCDYCDDVFNSKNCYLSRSMDNCEDLFYSYRNISVKNSIDVSVCFTSERCFDSVNSVNCYKVFYSWYSRDCVDSYFLFDCRNIQNCFMCWNLRNKSHCIENIQYTKEEYNEKLKSYNLGSYVSIQKIKERFVRLINEQAIHRQNFNIKTKNSEGNFLLNVNDCHNCHTVNDSENSFDCIRCANVKSVIDCSCFHTELAANCSCCLYCYDIKYCSWTLNSRYSEYCDICIDCENCFGCVGLKKKKYCILNKQYTKEEYENLKGKIIEKMKADGEYGQFMPWSMSAGPFNLSTGYLYFPDTKKEDILRLGGYWEDLEESRVDGLATNELPDDIADVLDSITTQALICPQTGWRFNIAEGELLFYRQNNIPLPREHFDVRIKNQMKYLTVITAYPYKCTYCNKDIEAYYPPEWGYQKVACEECYMRELS